MANAINHRLLKMVKLSLYVDTLLSGGDRIKRIQKTNGRQLTVFNIKSNTMNQAYLRMPLS